MKIKVRTQSFGDIDVDIPQTVKIIQKFLAFVELLGASFIIFL